MCLGNSPVKVNPEDPPPPQDYDRGPSSHTEDSDSSSFLHSDNTNGSNIDLLGGILTVKPHVRVGILMEKMYSYGQPGGPQDSHEESSWLV